GISPSRAAKPIWSLVKPVLCRSCTACSASDPSLKTPTTVVRPVVVAISLGISDLLSFVLVFLEPGVAVLFDVRNFAADSRRHMLRIVLGASAGVHNVGDDRLLVRDRDLLA